jgi:hypothetical protein
MGNYHVKLHLLPANVRSWDVKQVLALFVQFNFPTDAVESREVREVEGESLVTLYQEPDAGSTLLTASASAT